MITIIGFGITGMLTLAILQENITHNICIIDPYFDGGALLREYGDVLSNTPLQKTIDALKRIKSNYVLPQEYASYDVNKITPLHVIAHIIKDFTKSYLLKTTIYETKVSSLQYDSGWKIQTEDGNTIESTIVFFCQGAKAKQLKCNIPSIPLHIALDKNALKKYVKKTEQVIVFGTSHSGTLVLENLEQLSIQTTAIHKNKYPFLFAKDGEYDGIKEEAERIASSILNNEYKNIKLLHVSIIDEIIKATKQCDWIIYAIGFETLEIHNIDITKYDTKTGKILGQQNAYGFGIGYPSLAPDNLHVDVGVYSFVEHIQAQIPDILKLLP